MVVTWFRICGALVWLVGVLGFKSYWCFSCLLGSGVWVGLVFGGVANGLALRCGFVCVGWRLVVWLRVCCVAVCIVVISGLVWVSLVG